MGTGNYMVDDLLQEDHDDYKEWKRKRSQEYFDLFEDLFIEVYKQKLSYLKKEEKNENNNQ